MAITFRRLGSIIPTDLGQSGVDIVRLTGDGAATSVVVTLGVDSPIKTIRGAITGSRLTHNIPIGGVVSSTGFTLTLVAAADLPNLTTIDILIWGDGR